MSDKVIPYGRQQINQEDIDAVVKVLKSNNLTQGPMIRKFEIEFSKYVGSKYAVAVSSGTAALHLCTIALNTRPGDKVITTPLTFSASANCIRYCGGEVCFVDIDPNTYLMDLDKLEKLLLESPKGTYKGLIPVNFAGRVNDFKKINYLTKKYNLWVIEDACHSPGGFFSYDNSEIILSGNGEYKDLSIFSFHPVKHIAAGEGGMITTNDKNLYKRILNLRTHGIQQDKLLNINNHGVWYYEMQELGYNYRITDIQATLAISQLKRAKKGLLSRFRIVKYYERAFRNKNYIIKLPGFVIGHAYHLYVIQVKNRDGLINFLRENNIFAQVHYIPVHLMPYYKKFGWKSGDLPVVEKYYENCLTLPIYPSLTESEQKKVLDTINKFFNY
jgi:UDP-4-amino-4,6-dideoxy-N-acetyl-beta-L-altrosamine transaminase